MHWITEPKLSKERKMTNNIHVNARLETVFFKVFSQEKKAGIQHTCECTPENREKKKKKKLTYSVHVNARLKTVFSIITPSSPKLVIISMRL